MPVCLKLSKNGKLYLFESCLPPQKTTIHAVTEPITGTKPIWVVKRRHETRYIKMSSRRSPFFLSEKKDQNVAFSPPRGNRTNSECHFGRRSRPWGNRANNSPLTLQSTVNKRLSTIRHRYLPVYKTCRPDTSTSTVNSAHTRAAACTRSYF